MGRLMLVESTPFGTQIALLENGRLLEVHGEGRTESRVGEIHKGVVSRVVPAIDAAFVDIGTARNAFLFAADVRGVDAEGGVGIADVLRRGDVRLVQVVKDELPGKGPRVTTRLALPGRYLVLLPEGDGGGISRRILDPALRERGERWLEDLTPDDAGLILRTVSARATEDDLRRDLDLLRGRWAEIESRAAAARAPARVYRDLDPALRSVRDRFDDRVETAWVEGEETWRRIKSFVEAEAPHLADRVKLHTAGGSPFEAHGVDDELRAALEPRVALPSGGHLVIQPTEALVAVDVNSGSSVGEASLEATALATNLEAAAELARQARLRDLAGLIVIDFIDMDEPENRSRLVEKLEARLADDPARTQVTAVSEFGLVSLTRKRSRSSLYRRRARPCPACGGKGYVEALETARDELWRRVRRAAARRPGTEVVVRLEPELASFVRRGSPSAADTLSERFGPRVRLEEDDTLDPGAFSIEPGSSA